LVRQALEVTVLLLVPMVLILYLTLSLLLAVVAAVLMQLEVVLLAVQVVVRRGLMDTVVAQEHQDKAMLAARTQPMTFSKAVEEVAAQAQLEQQLPLPTAVLAVLALHLAFQVLA
jgi:uncharacterized membrane protein YfhO